MWENNNFLPHPRSSSGLTQPAKKFNSRSIQKEPLTRYVGMLPTVSFQSQGIGKYRLGDRGDLKCAWWKWLFSAFVIVRKGLIKHKSCAFKNVENIGCEIIIFGMRPL
jgi:hypothetical protein